MAAMPSTQTPYPEAARELLRETALRRRPRPAAAAPWSEITMADIAAAAGVSRQTLYKEFGSRDEFGHAFVIHEGERFLDDVDAAVREHLDDPRAAVVRGPRAFLITAGEDPLVRILLSDDGTGGMLPLSPPRACPWSSGRRPGSQRRSKRAGRRPRRRRRLLAESPGPPGDQLHHGAEPLARGDRQGGGELLGPFIDKALGSRID